MNRVVSCAEGHPVAGSQGPLLPHPDAHPVPPAEGRARALPLRDSQVAVLRVLCAHGPLCDEGIFLRLPLEMAPSGARTRRHELVLAGLVRDSGRRSTSTKGRPITLWEAVPA